MILVIGYGSLVRGDDGIGQILAEILAERLPAVEMIARTQLTLELAEPLSRAERVYFIDVCADEQPGTVTCQPLLPGLAGGAFTHNVPPVALLNAARELYGSTPEAFLIAVSGTSFDYGVNLSPELRAALPTLIETISGWIEEFCGQANTTRS